MPEIPFYNGNVKRYKLKDRKMDGFNKITNETLSNFSPIEIALNYIETIPSNKVRHRDYLYVEIDSFISFDRSTGRPRRPLLAVQAS